MKKILHFSYHKCLTVYYINVMTEFCHIAGCKYRHFDSDRESFERERNAAEFSILSVNNQKQDFELNANEIGSHFVRDPRDLLVSGYHYHLWCPEPWCKFPDYKWGVLTSDPVFQEYMPVKDWPEGISYQEFIGGLTKEQGLILEMIWRKKQFDGMQEWDYTNPKILELKYEDIINDEQSAFSRMFDHYEFDRQYLEAWTHVVDKYSLKNIKMGEKKHQRNGRAKQYQNEFTECMNNLFNSRYSRLLEKLGYSVE